MIAAAALALLAVGYSSAAPFVIAQRASLRQTPAATLFLWQSLALAGVIAAVGAGIAAALTAALTWTHTGPIGRGVAALAAAWAALVVVRLLLAGHRVGTRLRSVRNRHRHLLDLMAVTDERADVRIIESGLATAYCLPGFRQSRIVVSSGVLASLQPEELRAVLAHERAHLAARHDLVLEAFTVLNRAFPHAVAGAKAQAEVSVLIEILADRQAIRRVGARSLIRALSRMNGVVPEAALGTTGGASAGVTRTGISERLDVLLRPSRALRVQAGALVAMAVMVTAAPVGLLLAVWN